jgi:hypothetical protein
MKNETHPGKYQVDTIELLLAVALEVAQALLVLTVALVALLLTLARWRPSQAPAVTAPPATTDPPAPVPSPAASTDAPPTPLLHPLALVAEQLEALPVSRLRPLAGVTSKRHRKHELVAALVAC